ncbi:MAG: DNA replication/repair protein RecF [Lentisphaeria bacterium]|nr:DNA replication/repair protein RecF [Lentisphaeria bacterium]
MVAIGKEQFFLNASIENRNRTQDISVIESISGARQLFINRNLCRQVSDFLFEYRCVCFSPGDFAIGSGASGVRRRFIDQLISSNDRNYLLGLSGYVRALTQRNRAAKAKNEMAMRAFEVVMAENAPGIIAARRQTIFQLETQIRSLLAGKYDFSIRYKPDFDGGTEDFLRRFSSMRRREIQRGCTLTGVQLDDIELILNGKSLRTFGSTGQIRMVTLLMRLAEYTLLRRTPAPVMVLADDVTGELDDANRELFFRTVSTSDMRFHTYAALPGDGLLRDAQFIKL